jgi:hypothetical protein
MERKIITLVALMAFTISFAQFSHERVYSTFDNIKLAKVDTFNNGADSSGGFTHYGRFFNNNYNKAWSSWNGWSLSNMGDRTTAGFGNQYSSITGAGVSGTKNFMVGNGDGAYIKLQSATNVSGAYFTNNTYAALDMEQGSGFSKKFGGVSGDDEDYLRVNIYSYLEGAIVDSTQFYLADFRYADNSKDYILKDWTFVDFNNDASIDIMLDSISFKFESTDTGSFGVNTPKYFCMDDFNAISDSWVGGYEFNMDEDTFYNGVDQAGGFVLDQMFFPNNYNTDWNSWSGWSLSNHYDTITPGYSNQYSSMRKPSITFPESNVTIHQQCFISSGVKNEIRGPYLDGQNPSIFGLVVLPAPINLSITNTTYALRDMEQGSGFSKKFGGATGNDPDYFRLLVHSISIENDTIFTDTIYLADYRFADNSKDYILRDWKEARIEACHRVGFELESTDNSTFGMNTPSYFSLSLSQNFTASVTDVKGQISILAYPNPTAGILNLKAEEIIEKVQIIGLDGRVLYDNSNQISAKNSTINTAVFTPGVYFAVVTTAKGTATKRFIKQ